MAIIGIVGFIGSGKGTVGDILINDYGYHQDSFAKPLKDAASCIFGWDRSLLEGDSQESREFREKEDVFWSKKLNKKVTPRWVLQMLGTEAGRNIFGLNVWSASLEKRIQEKPNVVITDCRFMNEIAAIRQMGGKIIRVKRGPEPEWYDVAWLQNTFPQDSKNTMNDVMGGVFMEIQYKDVHRSEWDWVGTSFDVTIENKGTIDDLKKSVREMLRFFN